MPTSKWLAAAAAALLTAPFVVGVASPAAAASPASGPIVYRANTGDADYLRFTLEGDDVVISNTGASRLPASLVGRCRPQSAAAGVAARCAAKGEVRIVLDLKDGNDIALAFQFPARFPITADLGDGDDLIVGGEGTSVIRGGSGSDVIETGDGDDTLIGGPGSNLLDGGPGRDLLDGSAGTSDDLNLLFGEDGSDRIVGGEGLDFIYADGDTDLDPSNDSGRDLIDARGGSDFIDGGGDADVIAGGPGDDEITGDDGIDPDTGEPYLLTGEDGPDVISAGTGDDVLTGGGGRDLLTGDGGADTIDARDGEIDLVACGAGTDSAQVDTKPADRVDRGCETVGSAPAAGRRSAPTADATLAAVQDIRTESAGGRSVERILGLSTAFEALVGRPAA